MLVFFVILGIIIGINLILYLSTIKVELNILKKEHEGEKNNIELKIYFVFLNKIKWLQIKFDKNKLKNIKKPETFKFIIKILRNKNRNLLPNGNDFIKLINKSKAKFEKFNLEAEIGIENVIVLSYLVAIIDILISINLLKKAKDTRKEQYKYVITPYRTEKFYLNLTLNCVICIKISNIVKSIIQNKVDFQNVNSLKTSCNIK